MNSRMWGVIGLLAVLPLIGVTVHGDPATPRDRMVLADASARTSATVGPESAGLSRSPGLTQTQTLPGGRARVFDHRILVAYYGVAGSASLGVLGEDTPARMMPRLNRAARPFATPELKVQPVFELIVSVATWNPGPHHTYSHDIARADVRRYITEAHRHGALVILDLQTGRSDFLTVARRWAWALKDPWVGLALDPEWRMRPGQVPGREIGSVDAAEINRTSAWLDELARVNHLPEKVFMLHQFRTDMIRHIARVAPRAHLAEVQPVDGWGPPGAKLNTYHHVARPRQFTMGFKLFYDEDRPRMGAVRVRQVRPAVRFVSFQ